MNSETGRKANKKNRMTDGTRETILSMVSFQHRHQSAHFCSRLGRFKQIIRSVCGISFGQRATQRAQACRAVNGARGARTCHFSMAPVHGDNFRFVGTHRSDNLKWHLCC